MSKNITLGRPPEDCAGKEQGEHSTTACTKALTPINDALYALNGKWKLQIIIALGHGHKRFRDIQRAVKGITAKVLSKELKDLELNEFITRTVYDTTPVTVEYVLTPYSDSLDEVITALYNWGVQHRKRMLSGLHKEANVREEVLIKT